MNPHFARSFGPFRCLYAFNLSESQAVGDGSAGGVGSIVMDLDAVDARELEALVDKSRSGHRGHTLSGPMRVKPVADIEATLTDAAHEVAAADHRGI